MDVTVAVIGITKTDRTVGRPLLDLADDRAADALCGMLRGLSKIKRQHLNCKQTTY